MELRSHGARTIDGLFAGATAILAARAPLLTPLPARPEQNANLRDSPEERPRLVSALRGRLVEVL
jgi:hypothetical protein